VDVGSGPTPETPDEASEPIEGAEPAPLALDREFDLAAERLRRLRERGLLTEHEFEIAMDRVTGPGDTPSASGTP